MNLNPLEWSRAQDLLVKLVQMLAPLAERSNPPTGIPFSVTKSFFIPLQKNSFEFRHSARILTSLHSAKQEVDSWLGNLPETPSQPTSSKKERGEKPAQTSEKTVSPKGTSIAKEAGAATASGASPMAKGTNKEAKTGDPVSLMAAVPIPAQAQRVIDQVRLAILTLSNSANLLEPKSGPLRDALKRLKPLIDELIAAVSQDGMHSSGDGAPPLLRLKLPASREENASKKQIPFPASKKSSAPDRSASSIVAQKQGGEGDRKIGEDRFFRSKSSSLESSAHSLESSDKNRSSSPNRPSSAPAETDLTRSSRSDQGQEAVQNLEGEKNQIVNEKTSILSAPYTPETRPASSPGKTKKKEKRFFLREEEEEEPPR